jgi:branched-subunit amino acid transport protein AzlD
MKISYAITVCNELVEIQRLLPFLIENKRKQDEIVVFYDSNNGSKAV